MSEGQRRAALALHALAPQDRDWILGRLGTAQRRDLGALLAELGELGIPPAPDVIQPLIAAPPPEPAAVPPESARSRLMRASARDLAPLLTSEPPAIVARVLAADDWPWRDAFVAGLHRGRREDVRAAIEDGRREPAPAKLVEALLLHVDAALANGARGPARGRLGRARDAFARMHAWAARRRA